VIRAHCHENESRRQIARNPGLNRLRRVAEQSAGQGRGLLRARDVVFTSPAWTEITAPTISPARAAENTIDLKTGIFGQ
jgi:hypothetical protein